MYGEDFNTCWVDVRVSLRDKEVFVYFDKITSMLTDEMKNFLIKRKIRIIFLFTEHTLKHEAQNRIFTRRYP